jgi:hypothetical protein
MLDCTPDRGTAPADCRVGHQFEDLGIVAAPPLRGRRLARPAGRELGVDRASRSSGRSRRCNAERGSRRRSAHPIRLVVITTVRRRGGLGREERRFVGSSTGREA